MDETRAFSIVSALANGVNPLTGEVFPADSPYQTADVVRALILVMRLLETRSQPDPNPKARTRPPAPDNAGKPWSVEEDRRLLAQFDSGATIADLARDHGRTTAGIQARLEKQGRLDPASQPSSRRYPDTTGRGRPAAG